MFTSLVVLGLLLGAGPGEPDKVTVADMVKGLALDESKLEHIDEPPGKLQALECETVLRDTKARVRVRVEVVYTPDLFSSDRKWDPRAVRAATVRRVSVVPAAAGK